MDERQARAQRIIALLQAKADRTDNEDEKDAIESKINDLRVRYDLNATYPLPASFNKAYENYRYGRMPRDEFIRSFFGHPQPDHVTYMPTRAGKAYLFTWLSDMDPQPTTNEEGWRLIDNSENEE